MRGELERAESCSRRAIEINPRAINAYMNLISALMTSGRDAEAEKNLREVLRLKADHEQALNNLGVLLRKRERLAEAEDCFRRAIGAAPHFVPAYSNLGELLQSRGSVDEALAILEKAVQLAPGQPVIMYNLGSLLKEKGYVAKALEYLQRAAVLDPRRVDAHIQLGELQQRLGNNDEAIRHYKNALALAPESREALLRLEGIYRQVVPDWHFPMMNDEGRNDAYEQAIRRAVTPGCTVLEIGTGAGLLAMMAARAGAGHVYTCEVVRPVADKAEEIIWANGYSDRITVLKKRSTAVSVGADLPARADVLISEILDVGLLGEIVLPVIKHAANNLVKPGARIIPRSATVFAAVMQSEEIYHAQRVNRISGFDFNPFNEFAGKSYKQFRITRYRHELLTDPFEVFSFDLRGADIQDDHREICVNAKAAGTCHAIAFWFRMDLDETTSLDTGPSNEESCWMQAVQILDSTPEIQSGQSLRITTMHDCKSIRFKL